MEVTIDDKLVYEAFKDLLKGGNSSIRKAKAIESLINTNAEKPAIAALLKLQSAADLSKTVRSLIMDEIFSSETKRSERHARPVVTTPPSTQNVENSTGGPDPRLQTLKLFGNKSKDTLFFSNSRVTENSETLEVVTSPKATPTVSSCSTSPSGKTPDTSVTPREFGDNIVQTSLPYYAQYHLLSQMQQCLELACFDFAQDNLPGILKENNWGCREAAELNLFVKELAKHQSKLPGRNEVLEKISMAKLVNSVAEIRHSAVHRHHLTVSDIETFLEHSVYFLTLIADEERARIFRTWRLKTLDCLSELKDHELEATKSIDHIREQMEAKRLELKRQEEADVLRTEETREKFRQFAGARVLDTIKLSGVHNGRGISGDRKYGGILTSILIAISSGIWTVVFLVAVLIVTEVTVKAFHLSKYVI